MFFKDNSDLLAVTVTTSGSNSKDLGSTNKQRRFLVVDVYQVKQIKLKFLTIILKSWVASSLYLILLDCSCRTRCNSFGLGCCDFRRVSAGRRGRHGQRWLQVRQAWIPPVIISRYYSFSCLLFLVSREPYELSLVLAHMPSIWHKHTHTHTHMKVKRQKVGKF